MRSLILFFVLSAALTLTYAQSRFTALNGPFGAPVADQVIHSTGAIVVATQSNGIWRSTDAGASWTKRTTGTDNNFTDLDVDASGNIYATASVRIYKSTDGGATWINMNVTGLSTTIGRIRVASPTLIYVVSGFTGGSYPVYKSTNGTSFNLTSTDITSFPNELTVSPANSNVVYISTSSSGIKVSTDGGFVFNSPSSGSLGANEFIHSTVVNSTGVAFTLVMGGIHTSADNGNTWAPITGEMADILHSGKLALDSAQNLYFANASSKKVYVGNTTGSAWSAPVTYPAHISVIAFTVRTPTYWLLGSNNNGVFKTTDAGVNWTAINESLKSLNGQRIFITPQNRIFVTYNGTGYYQSIDNGSTWSFFSNVPADRQINGFVQLADNSVLAYGGGVLRSTGTIGNTWIIQNGAFSLTQVVTYDGSNLYAHNGTTVYYSNDQGVSWSTLASPGGFIQKIQVDVANNVYLRMSNSLYQIPFGTSSANFLNASLDFSVLNSDGASTIYTLVTSTQLQISTDAGLTWPVAKSINSAFTANRIWAFRNNVVLTTNSGSSSSSVNVSFDGGSTWTGNSLADAGGRATDIVLGANEEAFVATSYSTAYTTATTIIPPLAPTNLQVVGNLLDRTTILWDDNADNESEYLVEVSAGDNVSWEPYESFSVDETVQNKSWNILFLPEAGTTYFVRLAATNGAGQSAYSNEVSVTTQDTVCTSTIPDNRSWTGTAVADPGSTPLCLDACSSPTVNITGGSNTWTASLYTFFIAPTGPYPARPSGSNFTSITFRENCGEVVVLSSPYEMPNGAGTWDSASSTITLKWQTVPDYNFFQGTTTFVLNATDPVPPTPSFNAYIYSSTEVLINWSQANFAKAYNIYRGTVSGGTFSLVATVQYPENYHIDKSLTSGTTYYYKISASNDAGESPQSAEQGILLSNSTLFRPIESAISSNYENQQGVAWGDLDGDGDEDIATPSFTNSSGQTVPPVLYENAGAGEFVRRDVDVLANENTGISRGIGIFDFNNDGMLDMYIVRSGESLADLLLVNNGGWNFSKTTLADTELSPFAAFRGFGILDYDNDGFADIYVGNDNGGAVPATTTNLLLKNNGGAGFSKVTGGVETTDVNNSRTVAPADYDNDGDLDLFMLNWAGNGTLANRLYQNNGDGTFTKVTGLVFDSDLFAASRTASWGDIDNDGDLDLYVGAQTNVADRLYQNNGDGTFTSLTANTVAETATATYGSAFGDIDNDGDLDLIAVNSAANSIFVNSGTGSYTKSIISELLVNPNVFEIGGSFADFDKDGFLDFYPAKGSTGAVNLPNLLYKNTHTPSASKHWIEVKLQGTASNRAAIGARIKVTTTSPARVQIREITAATGYGSQNSLVQHFGLGTAATVSEIEIRWPSGAVNKYQNITVDQILSYIEDATGPEASTLLPANGAVNVSSATKIEVTLNETPTAIAGKKLHLSTVADPGTIVFEADVTSATKTGNKFSFTLPSKLNTSTSYQVTLDSGAFKDVHGNLSASMEAGSWTFTTGSGPAILSRTPANGATNVNTTTPLALTFDGPTATVAGKIINVYKQTDTATPVASLNANTGVISGNTITFTLPAKLLLQTAYTVTVDAGAFLDNLQNESAAMSLGSWTFTTTAGPPIVSRTPSAGATNVNTTTSLAVTFGGPTTTVAGKLINVYKQSDTVTPMASLNANTGIISGNTTTFTLPAKLLLQTGYTITIDEGAFLDEAQNPSAAVTLGSWTFTTTAGPPILSRTPSAGATNVNTTTSLAVTFGGPTTTVAGKLINVYKQSDTATPVASLNANTGVISGNTTTFTLPAKLLLQTGYTITIDEGAFLDDAQNPSAAVTLGSWTFTTTAGPPIISRTPVPGATNVNTTTSLAVTFGGPTTTVAGKLINVYKQSDTVTPVASLNANTGVISGNTTTFTLPAKLLLQTGYTIAVDEGAFLDAAQNPSPAVTLGSWTFTTTAGPQAVTFGPANGATDVANNASLEITFDGNVTAVAGKKIKVLNAGATVLDLDVSLNGTVTGAMYTIVPPTNWPYLTTLDVVVDAGAFVDASQNDFAGIGAGTWQFTVVEQPDVTPPIVTPPSVTTIAKGFGTSNLTFTVSDNKVVETVVVAVRKISGLEFANVTATPGNNINEYTIPLSESTHFDENGTEFFITATDISNNTTRSPAGDATQKIFLKFSETQSQIPADFLGLGGTKQSWRIFSIPFELASSNAVTSIFNELDTLKNKVDYRLITYGTESAWSEFPSGFASIQRGKGYFINIKDPIAITIANNLQAPPNSRSNLFQMNLAAGWNMVGNPYLTPISWDDVAAYNGLTGQSAELMKYNGTGYAKNQTLAAFEGGFVFTPTAIPGLDIPFLGQTGPGRKGFSSLGSDIGSAEWAVKFQLDQAGFVYPLGAIGMAPDAMPGFDDYDAVAPPRFFDYLEMNFEHPEFMAKRFSQDIVPSQNSFIWNFDVSSNLTGNADLTWDHSALASATKDLFLLDVSSQRLINMKETGVYSFDPKESSSFRIYFGEKLTVLPDRIHLGKAFPNPTFGTTTIPFTLSESGGASQFVELAVFDLTGRNAATLLHGRYNPGFHEVTWNARDLTPGFYTYRLTVQGQNGKKVQVNKLIIH
jgi:hypothetical protein